MMNQDDNQIKESIKKIISRVSRIDVGKITDHASLRDDLYIDSLQAAQIIILIQDEYSVKIDEIEIFNVDNIMDVIELVKEYKNKN